MANQDFAHTAHRDIRTIGALQTDWKMEAPFTGTVEKIKFTCKGFSNFSGTWNFDVKLNGTLQSVDISIDGSDITLQDPAGFAVTERDLIEPFITSLGGGGGTITGPVTVTYTFKPTAKSSLANNDNFGITDSADSDKPKGVLYSVLKSSLTTDIVNPAVAGLSWKQAVRVATAAAGTLATDFDNGSTVDGVAIATGDRILIKNQAAGAENGIYVVVASGAPTRATDADTAAEILQASVYVQEGTANADKQFVLTTNAPITLGTTALVFAEFTSGSSYTDEMAQDAVGAMVDASLVYVDATPLLTRAALTGDVTASQGANATTIANDAVTTAKIINDAVTYAKMQNASATARILARKTGGAGDYEESTIEEVLNFIASLAQGDVLYHNGTSFVRLAAGTTGHFLKTNGAGANPAWAAASGTGAVATDGIWDAKGDLAAGTGADTAARLAVGTNGQVLTADSAEATGLKWAAAGGGVDTANSPNANEYARFTDADTIEGRTVAETNADLQGTGLVADAAGFRNIPQNSQSAAYTTVAADSGKHILHPAADNNARTFTIDSNANVAYPIGTAITFINEINTVTIAITSDTLTLAGAGTTGSRTLAANGMATAVKITSTKWMISGEGLT